MVPTEQEILEDGLCATKFLMHMSAKNQIEGNCEAIRKLFEECYKTASEHNFKIFKIMQEKGYYDTMPADEDQIEQTIEMHQNMQEDLEEKLC